MASSKARQQRKTDALRNIPDGATVTAQKTPDGWTGTLTQRNGKTVTHTGRGLIGLVSSLAIAANEGSAS